MLSVVGTAGRPAFLADSDIEALRAGLHARNAEPHPFLKMGDRVRIRGGALAGMEGVVVRGKNNWRVVISLELIMQSVSVEVDWDELEPVARFARDMPGRLSLASISRLAVSREYSHA